MVTKKQKIKKTAKTKNFNFVGDVKEELKKISWTTKEELKIYTKIVVASTFVFGLVIYCADVVIQQALSVAGIMFKFFVG
ncbi:MAG: preprotein translocase subunit SecE [Waddliaceae bacterium]|jgi:preprotein translocase subunit SecE|nr:preprotein translocase subunit SecE [Waddliaceae bacterium]MBT3579081.1 preprotein translocase subunit SecE [Waddliaceae bacterium]MBT4444792.1 preprotein translocase subunit SecE [Waddliaceae bacterium]MBT6928061.1 preprotein translocase subunit SecE [Waddliaceae bacterium]MBT7264445.1 preprotein translocase subunit SecE [Waddliaceae bacterium]